MCIPIEAEVKLLAGSSSGRKQKFLRCPFPYELAEARYSGTVDEKLGYEVVD